MYIYQCLTALTQSIALTVFKINKILGWRQENFVSSSDKTFIFEGLLGTDSTYGL
jgi:hypothetical protein